MYFSIYGWTHSQKPHLPAMVYLTVILKSEVLYPPSRASESTDQSKETVDNDEDVLDSSIEPEEED